MTQENTQETQRTTTRTRLLHKFRRISYKFPSLRPFYFWVRYQFRPPWDTGVSPPELLAFIESHPPGKALDLGCGTGTNVITLAKHGWQSTGVDFVARAIKEGKAKARAAGVEVNLQVGNVAEPLALNGTFDLILDVGCLHSQQRENLKGYLDNLERLLAPGGTYLLYGFTKTHETKRPAITPKLIEAIPLKLVERKKGTERRRWPSAWLRFVKDDSDHEGTRKRIRNSESGTLER
jgi:SAM-dependent methyltransferase